MEVRMIRTTAYAKAALLAMATLSLAAGNAAFLKYPEGKAVSNKTGKPMAIFFFVDSAGKTPAC
jgi:hypothetical protein